MFSEEGGGFSGEEASSDGDDGQVVVRIKIGHKKMIIILHLIDNIKMVSYSLTS